MYYLENIFFQNFWSIILPEYTQIHFKKRKNHFFQSAFSMIWGSPNDPLLIAFIAWKIDTVDSVLNIIDSWKKADDVEWIVEWDDGMSADLPFENYTMQSYTIYDLQVVQRDCFSIMEMKNSRYLWGEKENCRESIQ